MEIRKKVQWMLGAGGGHLGTGGGHLGAGGALSPLESFAAGQRFQDDLNLSRVWEIMWAISHSPN